MTAVAGNVGVTVQTVSRWIRETNDENQWFLNVLTEEPAFRQFAQQKPVRDALDASLRNQRELILIELNRVIWAASDHVFYARSGAHALLQREWLSYAGWTRIGIGTGDRQIGLAVATASGNTLWRWAKLATYHETKPEQRDEATMKVGRALSYLRELADGRFLNDSEINYIAAWGASGACWCWFRLAEIEVEPGRRDEADTKAGKEYSYLRELADVRFRNDGRFALRAARCALEIVETSTRLIVGEIETAPARRDAASTKIGRALSYLRELADLRFRNNREIGRIAAWGAYYACNIYPKLGDRNRRQANLDWLRELRNRHGSSELYRLFNDANAQDVAPMS